VHSKWIQLALTACSFFLPILPAAADPPASPPPIPTSPPNGSIQSTVKPARVATIAFADASVVQTRAASGRFQLVGLHPNETVNIAIPVPGVGIGAFLAVQPLDGGTILGPSQVPVVNGAAAFRFQGGGQPGLYRVLVRGVGPSAALQFWVPNLQIPRANPPVLNPTH
jgi:hypothetical protein